MGSFFYDVDRVSWHFWNNYRTSMLPFIPYPEQNQYAPRHMFNLHPAGSFKKKSPTCITMKKVMVRPRPKEVTRTTNKTKNAVPHCCNFSCSTLPACPRCPSHQVFKGLRDIHSWFVMKAYKKYVGYLRTIYTIHCFSWFRFISRCFDW